MYKQDKILWQTRPHPIVALWTTIGVWFTLSILFILITKAKSILIDVIIIIIAGAISIVYGIFYWKSIKYTFTKVGLYSEKGILYRVKKFVPVYKVTNFSESQGLLQQILKISNVNVFTAGIGARIPEMFMGNIYQKDAIKVMKLLTKEMRKINVKSE